MNDHLDARLTQLGLHDLAKTDLVTVRAAVAIREAAIVTYFADLREEAERMLTAAIELLQEVVAHDDPRLAPVLLELADFAEERGALVRASAIRKRVEHIQAVGRRVA